MNKVFGLVLACLLLSPLSAYAACNTTGSPILVPDTLSRADVVACITASGRENTIALPAGSATWSSDVTITKGTWLKGAGIGQTIITFSGASTNLNLTPDATAIDNEEMIKVSGIEFDGNNVTNDFILLGGASSFATKPFKNLVIVDNKFKNASGASQSVAAIRSPGGLNGGGGTPGQIRGVIARNIFDRVNVLLILFANDTQVNGACNAWPYDWTNAAYYPFAYGMAGGGDNLYFEDNTILYSSSYSGTTPGWIETGWASRLVVRYNSFNYANSNVDELIDVHGFQQYSAYCQDGQQGTMLFEMYGNSWLNANGSPRWVNHRSSWGIFFNNALSGTGAGNVETNQYATVGEGGSGCNSQTTATTNGFNGQINNTYFFNMDHNGSTELPPGTSLAGGQCGIATNVDYWVQASSSINASPCTTLVCTSGIGRATTAPTGSCTTGVAMWVASTASNTQSASVIQNGILYKCTSTDVWTPYYRPYTHPHPLTVDASVPLRFSPMLNLRIAEALE